MITFLALVLIGVLEKKLSAFGGDASSGDIHRSVNPIRPFSGIGRTAPRSLLFGGDDVVVEIPSEVAHELLGRQRFAHVSRSMKLQETFSNEPSNIGIVHCHAALAMEDYSAVSVTQLCQPQNGQPAR